MVMTVFTWGLWKLFKRKALSVWSELAVMGADKEVPAAEQYFHAW
jgi:hypothetical protein